MRGVLQSSPGGAAIPIGGIDSDLPVETSEWNNPDSGGAAIDRVRSGVRATRVPLSAWALHSALVYTVVALAVYFSPDRFVGSGLWRYTVAPLSKWDGGWYLHIASQGYGEERQAAAFWPLWPTLMSAGHEATGLSAQTVGLILANAFFLGGLVCLYRLIGRIYGFPLASRATWIAALSPLSFFFSATYTESLFLLLTVSCLLFATSSQWTAAAVAAALAALTRNSGILILIPLAILLIQQRGWNPKRWLGPGIQLVAAGMMPVAFAWHLDRVQGDPLLTMRVQEEWGRRQAFPWETVSEAIHRMHRIYATGRHSCEVSASADAMRTCRDALGLGANDLSNDLSFMFFIGCALVLPLAIWRLKVWDSAYLIAGLLLPLFGPSSWDPLLSYARYVIVLFPIYVVAAMVLTWRPLYLLALFLGSSAMAGLLALFALRNFIS